MNTYSVKTREGTFDVKAEWMRTEGNAIEFVKTDGEVIAICSLYNVISVKLV